jgi:DNA-binding GntR family transcriptional regulator
VFGSAAQNEKNEIQQGKLEPGSSINIDQMSRDLGISKTPLKEAMIRLECEGFVTLQKTFV